MAGTELRSYVNCMSELIANIHSKTILGLTHFLSPFFSSLLQTTGITALMEAAKAGSLELVRAILRKGGNPNALDRKYFSAVHYAAMGGFFEVL